MKLNLRALAFALSLAGPSAALAGGGLFGANTPVDQQAERVLFVDEGADLWSAYIEIQYKGDPAAFAWIIPVPEVPQLDVWHAMAFDALDRITAPTYLPEWDCPYGPAVGDVNAPPETDSDLQLLAQARVGPFETVTLQSEDPHAVVEWLRQNSYRVVPEMEPFIALYTAQGMVFTAMRLAEGQTVDAIEPIKMTYHSPNPMVPLRLTSVAAMPEMGVKVWVLSDERFGPLNVPSITVADDEVRFDGWRHNYLPLVARKIDEVGGTASSPSTPSPHPICWTPSAAPPYPRTTARRGSSPEMPSLGCSRASPTSRASTPE